MLYLVRHAQPLSEQLPLESALPSDSENVLTALGVLQADRLALEFSRQGSARVLSSPLPRALQTARPIATALGVEIHIDQRLAERDYSQTSALTVQSWREIQRRNYFDPSISLAREETLASQRHRVALSFRDIESALQLAPDANLIAVCHGGTIEHLLGCITGTPVENMVRYFFACDCASICAIKAVLIDDHRLAYQIYAINSFTI